VIWPRVIRWLREHYPAWAPVYEQAIPRLSEGKLVLEMPKAVIGARADDQIGRSIVADAISALGHGSYEVTVEFVERRHGNSHAVLEHAVSLESREALKEEILGHERIQKVLAVFPEFTRIRIEDRRQYDVQWSEELVVHKAVGASGPKAAPVGPPEVTVYTDGSCYPNPGPGGWGAILASPGRPEKELSGSEMNTTNNRMEIMAALEALRALKVPCNVTLYTDSQYLQKAMTFRWYKGWAKNDWKTKPRDGKPGNEVKNRDLWEQLIESAAKHEIEWCWVKGHSGNAGNERADKLALQARQRATR